MSVQLPLFTGLLTAKNPDSTQFCEALKNKENQKSFFSFFEKNLKWISTHQELAVRSFKFLVKKTDVEDEPLRHLVNAIHRAKIDLSLLIMSNKQEVPALSLCLPRHLLEKGLRETLKSFVSSCTIEHVKNLLPLTRKKTGETLLQLLLKEKEFDVIQLLHNRLQVHSIDQFFAELTTAIDALMAQSWNEDLVMALEPLFALIQNEKMALKMRMETELKQLHRWALQNQEALITKKMRDLLSGEHGAAYTQSFITSSTLSSIAAEYLSEEIYDHIHSGKVPFVSLSDEDKKIALWALPPIHVKNTVGEISQGEADRRLESAVSMGQEDDYLTSIEEALQVVKMEKLDYINWEETDLLESASSVFLNDVKGFLSRISLSTLALAAKDGTLQAVVVAYLKAMTDSQCHVVIPQLSKETFLEILREVPKETLKLYLKMATPEQKRTFLETAFDKDVKKLIQEWPSKKYMRSRYEQALLFIKQIEKAMKAYLPSTDNTGLSITIQKRCTPLIQSLDKIISELSKPVLQASTSRQESVQIPEKFFCPIAGDLMQDPEGNSYEKEAILTWLKTSSSSPITRAPLSADQLSANQNLSREISAWKKKLRSQEDRASSSSNQPVNDDSSSKKKKTYHPNQK